MVKKEKYPIYFGATSNIILLARELRKEMTPAEKILWQELRNNKINGFKFRRQHPINRFIADFFCYEKMLVIEVDGSVHNEVLQKERDEMRTYILNEFGIKVIRFSNDQVVFSLPSVIEKIKNELQ